MSEGWNYGLDSFKTDLLNCSTSLLSGALHASYFYRAIRVGSVFSDYASTILIIWSLEVCNIMLSTTGVGSTVGLQKEKLRPGPDATQHLLLCKERSPV